MKAFLVDQIVTYETQKMVEFRSWLIGLMFRITQLGLIVYVIVYVIYLERGYQSSDIGVSGVTSKLKGIAYANMTHIPWIGERVWDVADYVIPPTQNSAFFVATNEVVTARQSLGKCADISDVPCSSQCAVGKITNAGSGVQTGQCVVETQTCEIFGWCPTENDTLPIPNGVLLKEVENFTVLIKNSVLFPRYDVHRRNIRGKGDLQNCPYEEGVEAKRYCPIFRLGDIIRYANDDKAAKSIWVKGGFVNIHIEWECDLDWSLDYCLPKYSFRRLDDENSKAGKGWNFRYAHKYIDQGVERRTLVKVYGIQFFITVDAKAYKFNFVQLTMNIGSGLALLGMATVVCDMIALYVVRKRELYRQAKVDVVRGEKPMLQEKDNANNHDETGSKLMRASF